MRAQVTPNRTEKEQEVRLDNTNLTEVVELRPRFIGGTPYLPDFIGTLSPGNYTLRFNWDSR